MAEENKTPLAIQDTAANPDKATTTLEVDGQSVALDALGPMIINSDGVSTSKRQMLRSRRKQLRALGDS